MARKVRSKAGDTVNAILYRETSRFDDDAEAALWEINPGLAAYGPVLPAGVVVAIPDLTESVSADQVINLWD